MNEPKQKVISIKRADDSVDGRVISYLQSDPLNEEQSFPELVLFTLKAYWLPLALFDEGLRGEKMRQIGIQAINKLEGQISNIRRICGIAPDPVHFIPTLTYQASSTVSNDNATLFGLIPDEQQARNNSQSLAQTHEVETEEDEDEDEEDDDWELMKIGKTEEMQEINKIFGV